MKIFKLSLKLLLRLYFWNFPEVSPWTIQKFFVLPKFYRSLRKFFCHCNVFLQFFFFLIPGLLIWNYFMISLVRFQENRKFHENISVTFSKWFQCLSGTFSQFVKYVRQFSQIFRKISKYFFLLFKIFWDLLNYFKISSKSSNISSKFSAILSYFFYYFSKYTLKIHWHFFEVFLKLSFRYHIISSQFSKFSCKLHRIFKRRIPKISCKNFLVFFQNSFPIFFLIFYNSFQYFLNSSKCDQVSFLFTCPLRFLWY